MMVSGHRREVFFDRYNIVSENDLREAAHLTSQHALNQEKATNVIPLRKKSKVRGLGHRMGTIEAPPVLSS
jgi:hypothetical protein